MTLPPRIPAKRTIFVTPPLNMPDIMRTFEEADRIEFVAVIEGAGTTSTVWIRGKQGQPRRSVC
jgi:hypothetical protein